MGNDQSSPAARKQHKAAAAVSAVTAAAKLSSEVVGRGRESLTTKEVEPTAPSTTANLEEEEAVLVDEPVLVESEDDLSSDEESLGDDDESEEEEDPEYDEFLMERLRILEDAKALKNVATHFLHPEAPVAPSPECFGRNYFDRPSAPEQLDADEAEEIALSLADAALLKKGAIQFAHPEAGVETEDPAATARCFFDRPSAPERLDADEAEEVARALSDAAELHKLAVDYAHPEVGVSTTDAAATARCYFDRPSAEDYEEEEVDADRDDVLEDMAALKKAAFQYLHPEAPVEVDPAAFGRNYFNRASAPETEDEDIDAERDEVLEDVAELRKLASDHMHPEKPVEVDPAAFGRNYFDRASAPQEEDPEEAEERAAALAEAQALKKLAVDFAHPEIGVATTDPAAFGRNYFGRPSAGEYEEEEVDADRDDVLADMAALKKLATDYAHPEKAVETTDATVFGRNYFGRPSAPETEDEDIDTERNDVLEDVAALKKLASDYSHPEKPVDVDPAAFGRNYYGRASAPQEEDQEDAEERAAALAEAKALKKLAVDFAHPEVGVTTSDATAFGRNYFGRPSADEYEEEDVDADRDDVLADMAALKKLASDYAHPEKSVVVDPASFGRNYFSRPSAPQEEDLEEAEERAAALAEAKALKKLAVDFAHPEVGVTTSDPAAFGRNFFGRPSAGEYEEEDVDADRDDVLADMAALKKLATDYAHPEKPVTVDATAFGRNYFSRASAPQEEDLEEAEERAAALAEAKALKKLAVDFAHPEIGVAAADATTFGRNFFGRPSAGEYEEEEVDADRDDVLADMAALKKLATDYAHPEKPVETTDASVFGRNYFSRASAPQEEDLEEAEERAAALAEAASLKKLARDFAHPERPVDVDPAAFGRNYFSRASAPEQEDETDVEECSAILAELSQLKELAKDYAHPELGVAATDPAAFGRNYFSRASAPEQDEQEDAEERACALADASRLGKLAADYAHPEVGVKTTDAAASARCYYSRYSSPTHQDSLVTAKSTAKPAAQSSLGGDFEHVPAAADQQQQKGKASAGDDGDLPRTSSSHMLFGMAEAS